MNRLQSVVILLWAAIGFFPSALASAQIPELVELVSQEAVQQDLGMARGSPEQMQLEQIAIDCNRELRAAAQLTAEQRAELENLKEQSGRRA